MAVIHSERWVIANSITEWCNVSACLSFKNDSLAQIRIIEFTIPHTTPYVGIAFRKNSTFYPKFKRAWHVLSETYGMYLKMAFNRNLSCSFQTIQEVYRTYLTDATFKTKACQTILVRRRNK